VYKKFFRILLEREELHLFHVPINCQSRVSAGGSAACQGPSLAQVVQEVTVGGVQLDEAHSKLRPKQVEWVHTALAMGSWFRLWVDFGPRAQEQAAALLAQVVARTQQLPLVLTDWVEGVHRSATPGWRCHLSSPASWESGV
jgi:hypothetical protein